MKRILSFYFIPVVIFLLLSFANLHDPTAKNIFMTVIASASLGLLAGFVFHMATIVKNKISGKQKKSQT